MLLAKSCLGNAYVFDLKSHVNTHFIRNDFNKITYPYKNLLRFKYVSEAKLVQLPNSKNYPEFKMIRSSGSEEMVYLAMLFFIQQHAIKPNQELWLEAFHMNPYSYNETDWFQEPNTKGKAILCVQKEKVKSSGFELTDSVNQFRWELKPGEMFLFDTHSIQQRHTNVEFEDEEGFQDLLIITAVWY